MDIYYNQYVPCLRWKQGEYQALSKLSTRTKDILKPLIEIPEIGYDFEKRIESKTIDEHLANISRRIEVNWGYRECYLDMHLIHSYERMNNGQHPLTFVFQELRAKCIMAIPIIDLKQDSDYQNALSAIVRADRRGACVRLNIEELTKSDLKDNLDTILQKHHIEYDECDFILDLGSPNFIPIDGFVNLIAVLINNIPLLNSWRSFSLIGTSFPRSMAEVPNGLSIQHRNEWLLYISLIRLLRNSNTRIPIFGDYGINHPEVINLDMRYVKPYASVRYTIDDGYLIVKGLNVRDYKFQQYRDLCQKVISNEYYCGVEFSEGDKYIYDCARGVASTGRLTTWRWVGTNHHIEKVVRDISNLSVS